MILCDLSGDLSNFPWALPGGLSNSSLRFGNEVFTDPASNLALGDLVSGALVLPGSVLSVVLGCLLGAVCCGMGVPRPLGRSLHCGVVGW